VELAGREQDPFGIGLYYGIWDYPLELTVRKLIKLGDHLRMSEQALRGHDDQRDAQLPEQLPPEQVEVLRRGRAVYDLDVVVRTELQEPFGSRTGVFGAG